MLKKKIVVSIFLLLIATSLWAQKAKMVTIEGGTFVPLYGATTKKPVG